MNSRVPANTLKVGAAIVALWIASEGIRLDAHIPTKGDVPTIGAGSTYYEDGTRVQLTDPPITRVRAIELATNLLDRDFGPCVRDSLGDTLVHPEEFKVAVDFAGQYGCYRWRNSSMARETRNGEYAKACRSYLKYKFAAGYDCSTPGNTRCMGVWTRQLKRYSDCMAVQA